MTHTEIIDSYGLANFARELNITNPHASQMKRTNSIPSAYWQQIANAKIATLEELAAAAAARKPSNIETVYERTDTLPSGFEINFTVGKIKPKKRG